MYLDLKQFRKIISTVMAFDILMGVLLVIIGIIINNELIMFIGMGLFFIIILLPSFRGLFKPFACIMGWHSYKYDIVIHDGLKYHKCQWCGHEGIVDSQGNLF